MYKIIRLSGREILDSRGRPTVEATCILESGSSGTCSVPSGASTGSAEALEMRDGDMRRYSGLGCRQAAGHICNQLHDAVSGRAFSMQAEFDKLLITLDGTQNKSRIGANAILACSLAFARSAAAQQRVPLYRHFAEMVDLSLQTIPQLTVNLFSGGRHAGGQVPIQDVLMVPIGARSVDESLSMVAEVYLAAANLVRKKYAMRLLRADEGGMAPQFPSAEVMLEDAIESIIAAKLVPGRDVSLAVDIAASHFFQDGDYHFGTEILHATDIIERLATWTERYPIISLEDGLAENDWEHWPELSRRLSGHTMILGDDLLCTNPDRIRRAIQARCANALLLKVNQIGTLTEAAEALQLARTAGWRVTVSARSGETEDNWLADLAVGWCAHQIKVGSITQSERLSKYNRLLAIEAETNLPLQFR